MTRSGTSRRRFRDLQATAERLAEEIRAMNVALEDNRLDHMTFVMTHHTRRPDPLDVHQTNS